MILITQRLIKIIKNAAKKSYPFESCGLLIGEKHGDDLMIITKVIKSKNVSESDQRYNFKIDPQVRFDLRRAFSSKKESSFYSDRLLGHYHSHPNQTSTPSTTDISMAYEADLIWLITSVVNFKVCDTKAHIFDNQTGNFRQITLKIET